MSNDYMENLRARAMQANNGDSSADYMDTLRKQAQGIADTNMSSTVSQAASSNPDQYAKQRAVAERLGVAPAVVEALPTEMNLRDKLRQIEHDAASVPQLKLRYADDDFAKLAHDDSGVLASIGNGFKWLVSAPGTDRNLANGAEYLARSAHSGLLSLTGSLGRLASEAVVSESDLAALYKDNPLGLQNMLDNGAAAAPIRFARSQQQGSEAAMEALSPEAKAQYGGLKYSTLEEDKSAWRSPIKIVGDAIQSLPSSLAMGISLYLTKGAGSTATAEALAAGLTPQAAKAAGILAAEKTMARVGAASEGVAGYTQQANQTREDADKVKDEVLATSEPYKKLIADGYDPKVARVLVSADAAKQAGVIAGIVDAAVNFVGGKFLGHIVGEGGKFAGVKGAVTESLTEFVQSPGEQFGQNLAMQKNMDPTQDLSEGVLESALQGLAVGGLTGGAMGHLATRASKEEKAAQVAEQHAQVLEAMQATMQASKLLERSPDTLRSYAQDLADEGVPMVYVDSAKLVEAGVDLQALAQAVPSVAAQLDQAHTGGDLAIPTGELLTNTIGTEFSQPLIDHARTDVNGMSRSEATTYMQEKGDALNAEIAKVMAAKENDTEFKAGRDQVQAQILTQLNDIKRFTPKVNEQYATLAANFYSVMAARSGMTVQDFADKYKLGFTANTAQGGQVMDQAVTVTPNASGDYLTAESPAGKVGGVVQDGALRINFAEVTEDQRGKGEGKALYTRLIDDAHAKGLKVVSDYTVEAPAVRVYDALERMGYKVTRNVAGTLEDGSVYGAGANTPAFEVGAKADNTLSQAQIEDPKVGVSKVLLTLGQNDDLYQYPRSDALDVRDIAADKSWVNDKGEVATVQVSDVDKNTDDNKLWMISNTTPDDDVAAGTKSWILTLPTGKHATLTQKNGEVYINVSGVGEGNGGSAVYDLAANYALNNGLVFVGDPNGVSPAAMRRRLENMLSSAIKYGTTDHLKPHPDQYLGDASIGVPPLDWTNGDTLGNIRSMVDVSIAATEYANPEGSTLVYNPATSHFESGSTGARIGPDEIAELAAGDQRTQGAGQGGVRTLQRTALFKSLVQSEGARRAFLESVRGQQDSGSANPSGALAGTFYQGDVKPADSPYETDLFGNPVPAPAGKAGSAARRTKAKAGDVQPAGTLRDTPAPAGDYHVRTIVGSETTRKLGASQVTNPAELAQATAYLYRSAVERFDGIVTDKDGKPLGVVGGFKGAIAQASVYPGTMVAEAVRIPGAAHVWFSHNHPSGNSSLSNADLNLTRTLADVFRGSGVEPMGLMAVSGNQYSFTIDGLGLHASQEPFHAPTSETPVPVVEREQVPSKSELDLVASPADAKRIAAAYYAQAKTPGIILLTSQNQIAAWVPVSPEMMGSLRYTGGLGAIYRAVSESNASAAIIVHGGELSAQGNLPGSSTPSANIAAALAKVDVRPLDSINVKTMASAAEQGLNVAASTMYQESRGQIAFANDITQQASVMSLLKNADLSTFIHESGHFFLEVQTDLANRIAARAAQGEQIGEGERSIMDDMNKTLAWMGVKATPEMSALDHWAYLTPDEKRPYHEQWARGFEAYAFEGKAPSLDLQHAFQTFRAWLVNVYRALLKSVNASKTDVAGAMKVELSDEVRSVMDRMLATSDQIAEAEAARDMGPLFKTAEQAGMTLDEFKAYHDQGTQATMDAVDELQARGLRDMQWLNNARSRKLKELQKMHDALRAQIAREVRSEVMSQPVYRAWTFLTSKATDKVVGEKPPGNAKGLNPEVDNLFTAIAKLGGLDRAEVKKLWGIDEKEKLESGVFGAPVVRKTGGLSTDAMAERLLEAGYLLPDENGRADADKFEELFDDQRRGTDRYSIQRDMAAAYGDAPLNLPELPEVGFGKLRTEELRRRYGTADDAVWRKLSELRMTSDEGGLDPDVVGELFGFSSGDELVKTLAATEPPKSVIEGMTDTRMLQEHGDLATPAGLERAADAAIHNDARARFVATELKALQKAMSVREKVPGQKNTVDVLARAARDYATAIIAKLRVRDIRPSQYAAAEARSAKAAAKAVGDIAQATLHKRNQLINLYATKAAYAAQDEVKAAVQYFKKFDTVSKTLDPKYAEQIHALLERFDLRVSTSLKALDKRKSLVEWAQAQVDQGLEPDIPPELLQEANRKSFKDMTVEEVRGLRDTIKQIEHLGRLKNRLLTAQANRDFQAAVEEISASINLEAGDRKADTRTPNTVLGDKLVGLKNFWAEHIKTATWARIMDGGKDGGPVWEYLIRTANTAGDTEVAMREKATKELAKLVAPVLKEGKMGGKGEFYPSINRTLNKEAKLAIALNMGNESNAQRLLGGEGWSIQQLQPVLNSLSAADWQFVQAIWDHFESYRPAIGAKEKRVYGKEPNWVEPTPVHTPYGELRGGYYPIKYDPRASERAESHADAEAAKRQLAGAYTSATTRRSFTKSRVEEVNGRPLLYSLDGIYNGVQEVIHDLTWHEWLIDANKLVRNKKIAEAMRSKYGPDAHQQFKKWLEDNAAGDHGAQGAGEKALAYIRQGVSVSGLGLNVMSALMQPLGITQSIVRIGPKWVGKGVAKFMGAPIETADAINEKSEFMRTRALTRLREINEVRSQVKGRTAAREAVDASAYFLMMRCQQAVDIPTWWGAYEKAIAEGNDESRAVALSDQAVIDAQGSGGVKDQSAIERGGPGIKLFTTFYSFFNTALNLGVQKTMNTESKAKLAADYLLLYSIPVILGAALKDAMTPGDSGDWDDWEHIIKRMVGEHLSFLLGLMVGVREVTGAAQAATGTAQFGTDYSGPAGVRALADLVKLGKQLHQGELDDGLRKAIVNTAGELLRLPAAQINRTINGAEALHDGKTQNPGALLTGYQEPR